MIITKRIIVTVPKDSKKRCKKIIAYVLKVSDTEQFLRLSYGNSETKTITKENKIITIIKARCSKGYDIDDLSIEKENLVKQRINELWKINNEG